MEGMYYFDANPMAPVETETMIHFKSVRRHTWSYHAVKAWYFAPSFKYYRVIKTTNEAGTVRTTDTWKYNHHSIKTPTVMPFDRIIKATKKLATAIQCHNDVPQDELQAIEHLRGLITGNSAPMSHRATEQQLEPLGNWYLEPEHSAELMSPVSECEPTTLDPQPIPVNNNALSPEVLSHKEYEENQEQHRYNLRPRPKVANDEVSTVHSQPPGVHPSLTRTTILPNVTRLRSRVAISNYDIDTSLIPSIKVQILQGKYAQGYGAANHELQLWQLQVTMHENLPKEVFPEQ